VTVKNNSTVAAADVNVVKVNDFSGLSKFLSITPSQGTCARRTCDLGRLAPGASATIVGVTRATHVGVIVNTVRVGSEEEESNYLNNTASAIARVTGPLRPPPGGVAVVVCRTLTAMPTRLQAGSTSIVLTTARDQFGRPVRGLPVKMSGLGLSRQARTNARGVARFALTPSRTGIVFFGSSRRSLAAAAAPCTTRVGVLGEAHTGGGQAGGGQAGKPSVTG
jgi:hypothetical protein